MSETPLSIIPESIFFSSEAENPSDASVGDGSRDGEPNPVKAMEIDGEANYGVEEQYLYMFRLLMPRWFPTPTPTSPIAAGGDGSLQSELDGDGSVGSPSEFSQLAHFLSNSCVSSSW